MSFKLDSRWLSNVPVIDLYYQYESSTDPEATVSLVNSVEEKYVELTQGRSHIPSDSNSCILHLHAEDVHTAVAQALFYLAVKIQEHNPAGILVCVGYPEQYVETLRNSGTERLPYFKRASSEENAMILLQQQHEKA